MYNCIKLKQETIRQVYKNFMVNDFPKSELKPLSTILKCLRKNMYICYGYYERIGNKNILRAYAYFARIRRKNGAGTVYLLDYFAVANAEKRGKGIGSLFLRDLLKRLGGAELILCEAEMPDGGDGIRQRRVNFYLKNGFADTGVTSDVFGVKYKLLAAGRSGHTRNEIKKLYGKIYLRFIPFWLYIFNIKIYR